jgi:opacity protein-like surface antigen
MGRLRLSALIGAIMVVAPTAGALAADYYPPQPVPHGGWYIRGDVGYKIYNTPTAIFDADPAFGPGYFVPGNGELFDETLSGAFIIGGGIGYDPTGPLRVDVTSDYETPGHFYGRLDCQTCGATYSEETADISAWTTLFNAYVDLIQSAAFTPYLGVGVGASHLVTTNVASNEPPNSSYPGAGKWNFAWAIMAGVSHQVSQNGVLDAGYRFLSLGEAQSGLIYDAQNDSGRLRYQKISAHEFRVGVRLLLP